MNTFFIASLSLIFICIVLIIYILRSLIKEQKIITANNLFYSMRAAYIIAFEQKIINNKEFSIILNELKDMSYKNILEKGFLSSIIDEDACKVNIICMQLQWIQSDDITKNNLVFTALAKFEKRYFDKVLLEKEETEEKQVSKPNNKESETGRTEGIIICIIIILVLILNTILPLRVINDPFLHFALTLIASILNLILIPFIFHVAYYLYKKKIMTETTTQPLVSKEEDKPKNSPDQMYNLLGVDALSVHVGSNLIELADPASGGRLIEDIGALRQSMTLNTGYILPAVRVCDAKANEENEYKILIRNNIITSSIVYPDRYLILQSHWNLTFDTPPTEFIEGLEPVLKEKTYWLKPDYLDELIANKTWNRPYLTAVQSIVYHLSETVIENINDLFTKADLQRVLDKIRKTNSVLVDNILNILSISILRKVLINLIREKVSVRDINYILENLEDLASETTDPDLLSEKLRLILYRQISAFIGTKNKTILALVLDNALEEKLTKFIQTVNHQFVLVLPPDESNSLIQKILDISKEIYLKHERKPVILVSTPSLRLPLARLILGSENNMAIIGHLELSDKFSLEILNTVELYQNAITN